MEIAVHVSWDWNVSYEKIKAEILLTVMIFRNASLFLLVHFQYRLESSLSFHMNIDLSLFCHSNKFVQSDVIEAID